MIGSSQVTSDCTSCLMTYPALSPLQLQSCRVSQPRAWKKAAYFPSAAYPNVLPHASARAGRNSTGKKTTKRCRGLGRLICLASVSVLGRQQRLWQRQQGAGRHSWHRGDQLQGHCGQDRTLLPGWSSKLEQSSPSCFATLLHFFKSPSPDLPQDPSCGLGT